MNDPRKSALARLILAGVTLASLAGLGLTCFGSILLHDRQFGFRDAGHYYYPLHLRVQQEWAAGRWPLWAPEANAGVPLLGNPTAAVLYPGKVVFFLLPYPAAARVYVTAHVFLAWGALWTLLRGFQVSRTGATLGALAYAFGAPVLSQTCNVIFLVGAAWAPLGFLAADCWLRSRRRWALPGLALVLAMQVLGGDPEAAYLTVFFAGLYAMGLAAGRAPSTMDWALKRVALGIVPVYLALLTLTWWSSRARHAAAMAASDESAPSLPPTGMLVLAAWAVVAIIGVRRVLQGQDRRGIVLTTAALLYASLLAATVAAAQLVPVVESVGLSYRAAEAEGHHDVYPFSFHPLLFAGSVWPDFYGTTDRGNCSWWVGLPPKHEDSLWMPSLYLGGMTLVFAAAAAGFRGGPSWRAWLTCVAVLSALAALGSYGSPLLWARCVPGWGYWLGPLEPPGITRVRSDGLFQDGDGGVYWLLASTLPGFRSFRYPAKLLTFTALAIAGLAGAGWDRLTTGGSRRALAVAAGLFAASLTALLTTWLGGERLRSALQALAAISVSGFGPLDVAGAVAGLRRSFIQSSLSYLGAGMLAMAAARRPSLAGALVIGALALDLGLANARQVVSTAQSAFEGTPRAVERIRAAEAGNPNPGLFRVQRVGLWWPAEWYEHGSTDRLHEIIHWERGTLRPNYAMPLGVPMTFVFDTTSTIDYASFLFPWKIPLDEAATLGTGLKPGQEVYYHPRRGFDMWNTRYFVVPSFVEWDSLERGFGAFIPRTTQIYPPPGSFSGLDGPARRRRWETSDDVRILRNEAAYPRAWVVHHARILPPVERSGPVSRRKLDLEILYQNDELWHEPRLTARDPHEMAWVETDRPGSELAPYLSRARSDASETVTITRDEPQLVAMNARLRTPGLVVVADAYYPGWTLHVDGHPAEILRTNRAMRGVALEAGAHELVFSYEPLSFRIGLGLSLLGLIVLTVHLVWSLVGYPLESRGQTRHTLRTSGQ